MGGKKATSTSQVTIPPEVLARYNAVNAKAEAAAAKPFQSFGTTAADYVAQINPQQTAGIAGVNTAAGSYQPYLASASSATQGAMGGLTAADIQKYMSPYLSNVADTTAALMRQSNEQAQSGALGTAAMSGAFGGDRAGIAAANLAGQNQLAMGKAMADIYQQGYGQALGAAQQQQGVQLQGAQQLANLGAQAQGLGLQGAQAQLAAGTMQQQTEQAGKDAMVQRFMQEQGYPFQTAQFLANIALGTGTASGSTTTTKQPTGIFGNLASGGRVDGYATGGGVAGQDGYVPQGEVPVGQLMVAQPPQQREGGLGKIISLATKFMASGGVAGDRSGYDVGGAPSASGYKEYAVNGDMWHRGPSGVIADAFGNPVDIGRAETVRNAMESQDLLAGGQRLAQSDEMARQFRQSQEDAASALAQRNKDALAGMYEGSFPPSGLAVASRNTPGSFPAAGMPAATPALSLAHPVNPDAAFKANLGAAYSNMGSAEAAQERAGRAGESAPQRPAGLGVAAPTAAAPTGLGAAAPAPAQPTGVAAPAVSLFDTKIVPIESGGRQTDEAGRPLTSPAGAVGAAQVMESTGPEAAKLAGLPWDRDRWMYDRDYNLALGRAYFNEQLRQFGSPELAAAAYNAGPGAVRSAMDRATALGGSYLDYLPTETQDYVAKFSGNGAARPQPTGGLGAAQAPVEAAPGGVKPYADRNAVGQFLHNPETNKLDRNAVLSVLAGLGTMASSRTLSPVAALLQGVGAGAGTYADLQKQAAEVAFQNAQTRRENIASGKEAYTIIPGVGPVRLDEGGGYSPVTTGAAGALPYSQKPDLTGTVFATPAAQDAFASVGNSIQTGADWNALAAQSSDILTKAQDAASNAYSNANATNEQARAIFNLNNSTFGQPGTFASPRDAIIKLGNTMLRMVDPGATISSTDTDNAILEKFRAGQAAMAAAGFDQNSVQALSMLAEGLPSGSLPPGANSIIMAASLVARQRATDLARFTNDFMGANPNGRFAQGAELLFNRTYADKFAREQDLLTELFNMKVPFGNGQPSPVDLLTSGKLGPADTQNLLKHLLGNEIPSDMYTIFTPFQAGGI